MDIGKRIKQAREFKGLKQKDFASQLNIDTSQYSKIESGKLLPTLNQVIEIGRILDVSYDWIITGKEINNESSNLKESNTYEREKLDLAMQNIKLQDEIIKLKDKCFDIEKQLINVKHKSPHQARHNIHASEPESKLKAK